MRSSSPNLLWIAPKPLHAISALLVDPLCLIDLGRFRALPLAYPTFWSPCTLLTMWCNIPSRGAPSARQCRPSRRPERAPATPEAIPFAPPRPGDFRSRPKDSGASLSSAEPSPVAPRPSARVFPEFPSPSSLNRFPHSLFLLKPVQHRATSPFASATPQYLPRAQQRLPRSFLPHLRPRSPPWTPLPPELLPASLLPFLPLEILPGSPLTRSPTFSCAGTRSRARSIDPEELHRGPFSPSPFPPLSPLINLGNGFLRSS